MGNERQAAARRQQSVNAAVKSICDIMRRSNCAGALQYVPELTWILFLRILDERETREAEEAEAVGRRRSRHRWRRPTAGGTGPRPDGAEAQASCRTGALGAFFDFVNADLLPHLQGAAATGPNATPRQKVISEIMSGVERVRIDTERNFLDVLDKVHEISAETRGHRRTSSRSRRSTRACCSRWARRATTAASSSRRARSSGRWSRPSTRSVGETVYDPGCGTGGFLAQSFEHMRGAGWATTPPADQLETLKQRTFCGREKENLIYPIALANLVLHGIDEPQPLARQHADRPGDLRRPVRGRAARSST